VEKGIDWINTKIDRTEMKPLVTRINPQYNTVSSLKYFFLLDLTRGNFSELMNSRRILENITSLYHAYTDSDSTMMEFVA